MSIVDKRKEITLDMVEASVRAVTKAQAELEASAIKRVEFETMHDIKWPPIDISKLKASDKGREVVYVNKHQRGCEWPIIEQGIISSWNDTYIFVRFKVDLMIFKHTQEPYQQQAKGCSARDLHFLKP